MKFKDIISNVETFVPDKEMTLSGYLYVTAKFAYLAENENVTTDNCICVSEDLFNVFLDEGIPLALGTLVSFEGKVKLTGKLTRTGMPLIPVQISQVTHVEYEQCGELYTIELC